MQPVEPPQTQPPKILAQGINSIFGVRQVMFKVVALKPGDKEQCYILGEGQRQDEVEVVTIDQENGSVTFNNHGTLQTLMLNADTNSPRTGPGPKTIPWPVNRSTGTPPPQPAHPALSAGEQTVIIEVERERTKAQVEAGELPPLPPTELTPSNSK